MPTMKEHALHNVADELAHAMGKFGPMASAHEGYAVILEEVDELWKAIKSDNDVDAPTRVIQMRAEATQVAAMALRFIIDVVPYAMVVEPDDQSSVAARYAADRWHALRVRAETAERERDEALRSRDHVVEHEATELAFQRARADAARAALAKYGRHLHAGCSSFGPATICTCGLTDALNASPS